MECYSSHPWFVPLIIILVIWEFVWKLIGLWKSARNNHRTFFILCALTNTLGIVPIIYILVQKKKQQNG